MPNSEQGEYAMQPMQGKDVHVRRFVKHACSIVSQLMYYLDQNAGHVNKILLNNNL